MTGFLCRSVSYSARVLIHILEKSISGSKPSQDSRTGNLDIKLNYRKVRNYQTLMNEFLAMNYFEKVMLYRVSVLFLSSNCLLLCVGFLYKEPKESWS